MRQIMKRSWYLSMAGVISSALLVSSCSAPDRLSNDDLSLDTTKAIVKERLISPVEDERIVEFNKKLPRRSILQVVHAPDSLSDPTFLQLIENKLSDEINFRKLQDDLAGIEPAAITKPVELSEAEKQSIQTKRAQAREKFLFEEGFELEELLFSKLSTLETDVDDLFLETIPLESNVGSFPEFIGANLTADQNGFLSLPADIYLIGGENSTFTSKISTLSDIVNDKDITLSVRDLPLQDALGIIAGSLGIEYSVSQGISAVDTSLSLSIQSNALSILDAILTQNNLAILYDDSLGVARFYTDIELVLIDEQVKSAIRGYNELHLAKKKYERARGDASKIKDMITIAQTLLDGDERAFSTGVKSFPRSLMGEAAREAMAELTKRNSDIHQKLTSFDEETIALVEPNSQNSSSAFAQGASGRNLNDILVEDNCIIKGNEIFVEKIAVYNADSEQAKQHVIDYFAQNTPTDNTAQGNAEEAGDEVGDEAGEAEEDGASSILDAASAAVAQAVSTCPEYEVKLVHDTTGVIITGRRQDNSLAMRIIEEYDVPKLQVLVEIFMVTVSRDFNRQISNLITRAVGVPGGNGITEAALRGTTITTDTGSIGADTLVNISNAIEGGYSVQLNSPKADNQGSLISSALSFLESNQLGRVLSSPTILVQDETETASIKREQVAKLVYQEQDNDNGTVTTRLVEAEEKAPFELTLRDVKVFPANRTVRMGVKILNKRFTETNINLITTRDQADYTEDTIETAFTAAPGDVIVLAGLAANADSTATSGLPGTTGALAPVSPLLGGTDQITSNVSEMIIFMAPTVIDPSSDFQPHSAFGVSTKAAEDEAKETEEDAKEAE